jgi:hypothetical protein
MDNKNYLAISVAQELVFESQVPKDPNLAKLSKHPNVKKFIALSKSLIDDPDEKRGREELKNLLKDPKVRAYLIASEKVGQRIGWIQGGISGGAIGTVIGAATAGALGWPGAAIAALGLLGAAAGGAIVGYPMSKIVGILRRWKTEEEMTKGGLGSGTIVRI